MIFLVGLQDPFTTSVLESFELETMLGEFLEASRHVRAALRDMAICWIHALKSGVKTEPLLRDFLLPLFPPLHLGGIHVFGSEGSTGVRFRDGACMVSILQSQRYSIPLL